ncbi:MAG TPA: lysophospholipid acyltransferase family protein [Anaerolineaceae bacterium]|jgi:1-acyl-sn-glycerol-3-phosphate acyltransferase|nr:lysophospholipid acyltransferase family protein [Anaerolineaceae bacterium]
MKRDTLQKTLRFLMRLLTDTRFEGLDNIPVQGGVILATNHLSRLDIPVLFINPVRSDVTGLVADKYKRHSIIAWFTRQAQGIWLDRTKADFSAFRDAVAVLGQQRALGIAPEGTRSMGQLLEGKPGTILIATRANVPIVPVAITGTKGGMKKILTLRRPHISVRFGPAFQIPPLNRENREAELKRWTDELMCRIAVMLPENYRGVYVNHPRVAELIAAGY